LVAASPRFKAEAPAPAAAGFRDRGRRDLDLCERGAHVFSGATYARQDIIFEISSARRGLAGEAKRFVDDRRWKWERFHDVLHSGVNRARGGPNRAARVSKRTLPKKKAPPHNIVRWGSARAIAG